MMAILAAVSKIIGLGGVIAVCMFFFYEGIPGASRIPFITSIPVVSDIIAGRVATYAAQKVKEATESMASKYELQSAQYQLEKERLLRSAADQANTEAQKRADASAALASQRQEQIDQLAADAASDVDLSRPSERDRAWLKSHQ